MVKFSKDLVYDVEHNLKLDLYVNEAKDKKQISLIIIHGGGWIKGSKDQETEFATKFVTLGYDVVVPDYRLAPPNFYPAPQEDIEHVYQWTLNNFPDNQIATIGSSAGGTMAVELAIKYGILAVSLSGIFDIEKWIKKHSKVKPSLSFMKDDDPKIQKKLNDQFYKGFILNYINNNDEILRKITPYYRVNRSTGPIFIFNCLNELSPISGVLKLEKALAKHDVPCCVQLLPGNRHAGGYKMELINEIDNFLKKAIKKD